MSEAQAKANEKYRKTNVKSFNVKFFPADADVLAYFQPKRTATSTSRTSSAKIWNVQRPTGKMSKPKMATNAF